MIARKLMNELTAKELNTSLLNINQKMENLNIEYNYADLIATISQFEYYYNLLSKSLGADYSIKVNTKIEHNGKIRIDLVKAGKPLTLDNVNTTFHLATDMLVDFNTQIRSMYNEVFNTYSNTYSETVGGVDSAASEYISSLSQEVAALQESAADKGATNTEIGQALQEAAAETQEKAEEAKDEAADVWESVWSTNNASTSAEQEAAAAAAQAFAEDQARQNELNNEASQARSDANAAQEAANAAAAALDAADAAVEAAREAWEAADTALGQAIGEQNAAYGLEGGAGYDHTTNTFVPGTYENDNTVYTVVDNGDGTVTITSTYVDTDGNMLTSTETKSNDASGYASYMSEAEAKIAQTEEDFDSTQRDYITAMNEYADAKANSNAATAAAAQADAKADAAEQAAADASIPVASGNDLDNGWYNDSGSEGVAETDESIVNDFDFGD